MAKDTPEPTPAPLTESTLLSALEIVLAKFANGGGGLSKEDLQSVLNANTEAVRRAAKPENPTAPNVSAFNPTGGERPALSRTTFFVGARMSEDLLTNQEIEAFNAIASSSESRNGQWTAKVIRNGQVQELHVMVPHQEVSQRMDLPSLLLILKELKDGKASADPATMLDRIAELERQLAAQ